MVCRQLGYASSIKHYSNSHFGTVSGKHSYASVDCFGSETHLEDCFHVDYTESCGQYNGAGVFCTSQSVTTSSPVESTTTTSFWEKEHSPSSESFISFEGRNFIFDSI